MTQKWIVYPDQISMYLPICPHPSIRLRMWFHDSSSWSLQWRKHACKTPSVALIVLIRLLRIRGYCWLDCRQGHRCPTQVLECPLRSLLSNRRAFFHPENWFIQCQIRQHGRFVACPFDEWVKVRGFGHLDCGAWWSTGNVEVQNHVFATRWVNYYPWGDMAISVPWSNGRRSGVVEG